MVNLVKTMKQEIMSYKEEVTLKAAGGNNDE
jgi:hypothetical protein